MKSIQALLLAAALTATASLQAQTPIKIGFMAELSGPQGVTGQDQYDGFMMVVQRNGGKLGGVPVEVIREDSQLKPDVALQLTQKLIEKEKVSIITGITFSNIMMAVHKPDRCIILQRPQQHAELGPRDVEWSQATDGAEPAECIPVAATA